MRITDTMNFDIFVTSHTIIANTILVLVGKNEDTAGTLSDCTQQYVVNSYRYEGDGDLLTLAQFAEEHDFCTLTGYATDDFGKANAVFLSLIGEYMRSEIEL